MAGEHVDAPDEHRRDEEQRDQPCRRQVAGQDQRDADDADRGEGAVEQPAAASGHPHLDGQDRVEGVVDDRREVGVAAQHVGLAQRGAYVVTGGDALLGGRGMVGPGCLLDDLALGDLGEQAADREVGDDRGQREQEGRRPPGEGRDHPQRAGGEEGARGLPHAPAHQLADLPRVVVDAVEDLADRLLGELGQRLRHGRVEQVGTQLPLGAVADGGPDGLGDRVDHRPAHDAQRQEGQERAGRAVGEASGDHRAEGRRDGAEQGHREAEVGQRTADPVPVDRHPTRRQSVGRGRGRRCRVGLRLGHRHNHQTLRVGTDIARPIFV